MLLHQLSTSNSHFPLVSLVGVASVVGLIIVLMIATSFTFILGLETVFLLSFPLQILSLARGLVNEGGFTTPRDGVAEKVETILPFKNIPLSSLGLFIPYKHILDPVK